MSEEKVKVAIVGASGYSGAQLVRLLLAHPRVEISCATSRSNDGRSLSDVFPRLRGIGSADSLMFTQPDVAAICQSGAEIAILALPHGLASEYALPLLEGGLKVIDLSADFRLSDAEVYAEFYDHEHPAPEWLDRAVYGMPEVRREAIADAQLIASPGCYPTSMILPLIPLLRAQLVDPATIHCFSMSGTSGAGRSASVPMLFAECNESVRAYSVPKHRHLSEVEQELSIAADTSVTISFTPHLMPVTAGILTTTMVSLREGVLPEQVGEVLTSAYADEPFIRLTGGTPADTKNVVGSNYIDIGWQHDPRTGRIVLMSAEDNLIKGASGQAIQSLNILCGFPESTGLQGI